MQKLPTEMTYEELVQQFEELDMQKEDAEAGLSVIKEELMLRLNAEQLDGKVVGEWGMKKATRLSFKTTVEQARQFAAIKEAVDTEMLKVLHMQGFDVPGASITTYLTMRRVKKAEGA